MMNDDFMKKFRKRPNPSFVRSLYERLEGTERRNTMFSNKSRFALTGLIALLLVAIGLVVNSPTARAAIRDLIMSFNGVDVYKDTETGKLEASGNLDAVVIQEDHVIGIESDDGTELEVVAEIDVHAEAMPLDELLSMYPGFQVPTNLPEGYTLNQNGMNLVDQSDEPHGLMVSWSHPNGESISLVRSKMLTPPPTEKIDGKDVVVEVSMETGYVLRDSSVDDSMDAVYTWIDETYTYHYMLTATDETLSEADLAAIVE
jgi:hypothetical protein